MSRVMVALSGGVDSSVAAALLLRAGHDVTAVTLKLWGGESDSGCCSVSDVADARRAAHALGIEHHVFNLSDTFENAVVQPYVDAHAVGLTPNPCIECNRSVKFDHLLERSRVLGFDALATGHHARVVEHAGHRWLARGRDVAKDQSYVLHPLIGVDLDTLLFPVGEIDDKEDVRRIAREHALPTSDKPDSQDVCFITATGGRRTFLGDRIGLRPGRLVDTSGAEVGSVDEFELLTIGQRRGLGLAGGHEPRYVVATDPVERTATVGTRAELNAGELDLVDLMWAPPLGTPASSGHEAGERSNGPGQPRPVLAQVSAHGDPAGASVVGGRLLWDRPQRRVAPGQSIVFYDDDRVIGSAIAR